MKTRTFIDEIYESRFVLLWGATAEQFKQHIRARYDKSYDGDVDFVGRCFETNAPTVHTVIIMLPNWRRTPRGLAILVHELFHAVEYTLRARGIEHTDETSEAYAYFLDSLVRRCLNILP